VSKHIRVIAKTLLQTQQQRPVRFRVYLLKSLDFFWRVLQNVGFDVKAVPVFEDFTVQSLQFMSRVVGCKQYGRSGSNGFSAQFSTARGVQFDSEAAKLAAKLVEEALSPQFISSLTKLCVTRFLVLRRGDLEQWRSAPEEFYQEEVQLTAATHLPATDCH
jgi:hypothetical protein